MVYGGVCHCFGVRREAGKEAKASAGEWNGERSTRAADDGEHDERMGLERCI